MRQQIEEELRCYLNEKERQLFGEITEQIVENRIQLENELIERMKDIPIINGMEDRDWYESELYHWYISDIRD